MVCLSVPMLGLLLIWVESQENEVRLFVFCLDLATALKKTSVWMTPLTIDRNRLQMSWQGGLLPNRVCSRSSRFRRKSRWSLMYWSPLKFENLDSFLPLTKFHSFLTTKQLTAYLCPLRVGFNVPDFASNIFIVLSPEHVVTEIKKPLRLRIRIMSVCRRGRVSACLYLEILKLGY